MNTIKRIHFYVSVSVLAMFVLAITACGSAEVDNIEGKLTQDGTPAVGIIVKLRAKEAAESVPQATQANLSQETKTDDNGHFAFQNVPPGRYVITIEVKEESQGMNCTYNKNVTHHSRNRRALC